MNRRLSIVLPVHQGPAALSATVSELIEIVPELTTRFELIVVEHGSTDDAAEVALELSLRYPQVQVLHRPQRLDDEAAFRVGLEVARGDVIAIRDADTPVPACELPKLWRAMHDHHVVCARPWGQSDSAALHLPAAMIRHGRHTADRLDKLAAGGWQLFDRLVFHYVSDNWPRRRDLLAALTDRGYHCAAVDVRTGSSADRLLSSYRAAAPAAQQAVRPGAPSMTRGAANTSPIRQPNFLKRLRDFALGE